MLKPEAFLIRASGYCAITSGKIAKAGCLEVAVFKTWGLYAL